MSFILDALKKSETERQRGDAPALYEMKMAPPRQGVATWLIVLAALLVINIVVLSVVLLRGNHGAPAAVDAGTAAAPVTAPVTAPAAIQPPLPAPTVITPAPEPTPVTTPPATAAAQNPGATDDDAPAVEAPRGAAGGGVQAGNQGGVEATGGNSGELPTYQQAATAPGANLPELALNLHSYSTNPADRFIFLNMTKLREGQSSPQGVRVETITPDGAILSWQGSKFLLQRQ
jgi:general secretion pathway protein B